MKRRILLDVDGVLADFTQVAIEWAEREVRQRFTRDSITEHDILKPWKLEHLQECFDRYVSRPGVCEGLMPLPGAHEFVRTLRERADVVIVTSPYSAAPTWCYERLRWLEKHFGIPKADVIFAKRKGLVSGDVLIDDYPKNLEEFRGVAFLMDQPWNRLSNPAGANRVVNLPHAISRLEQFWLI